MQDYKLSIKINHKKPIGLKSFSKSLISVCDLYSYHVKKEQDIETRKDKFLYIEKIEKGSIEVFLTNLYQALPLIKDFNACYSFYFYFTNLIKGFIVGKNIEKVSKKETKNINSFNKNYIQDSESSGNITLIDNSTTINEFVFNYADAVKVDKNSSNYKENKAEEIKKKFSMYWAIANFNSSDNKEKGKVIINGIDKNSKKVIFENEKDRHYCMTSQEKDSFKKEWQDLIYVVDVTVFLY